jgi:hypothetical protein
MKIYRTAYSLVTLVYLPLFAVYLLLYLFGNQQLLGFRQVHWVFLILALLTLVSPLRKTRFGAEQDQLPWPKWLLSITGFISVLSGYFYFSHRFLGEVLTISKPTQLPSTAFFDPLQSGGFFPWALIGLFAIALQRVYGEKKNTGLFSDFLGPLFNTTQHNNIGKYCNTYVRITIFFSLSLPFVFIGLAGLYLFMHFSNIPLPIGISVQTLFVTSVLFYVINFSQWPLFLNWLMKIRCSILAGMLILLCSGVVLLAILLASIQALPLSIQVHYSPFNPAAWPVLWEMLDIFIALSWLPVASTTIAALSRGYRTDQIMVATLSVPIVLTLLSASQSAFAKGLTINNPVNISIALVACSVALLLIFLRASIITALWRGAFFGSLLLKQRKPILYLRSLLVASMGLIGIFWVTGIYVITLLVTAFTLSSALLIMIALSADLTTPSKHRG